MSTQSSAPKFGIFSMIVEAILISLSSTRPVIFTRLVPKPGDKDAPEHVTHAIRLDNPDSTRIGFDELRSAFPQTLGHLDDEQLLTTLIERTDDFKNCTAEVSIEAQLKNGVPVKGPQGQPYFNIRLRSAVRNLDHDAANTIAKRLLANQAKSDALDKALADQNSG